MINVGNARIATELYNVGVIDEREWARRVLGENEYNTYSTDYLKRGIRIFTLALDNMENVVGDSSDSNLKDEIILERKKLQAVNVQAQEYYRERGRYELLIEQLKEAISQLEPFEIKPIERLDGIGEKTGLLIVSDCHYDSNYCIKGPNGETVCVYNKEVFKERMSNLFYMISEDEIADFDKLKIVFLGDSLENILRASSLRKIRQPVVKSVVEFAEYISNWILNIRNTFGVPVEVAFVPGNHTVCRVLSPKPNFDDENLEYIIHAFVKLRLQDIPELTVAPYNDVYLTEMYNENLLFAHGEIKELEDVMAFYENFYGTNIDTCFGGHFHSESSKSVGVGEVGSKRVIRVPSIIGTDPYTKKILKNNRAGAYFAVYDDCGECFNKIYWLS